MCQMYNIELRNSLIFKFKLITHNVKYKKNSPSLSIFCLSQGSLALQNFSWTALISRKHLQKVIFFNFLSNIFTNISATEYG